MVLVRVYLLNVYIGTLDRTIRQRVKMIFEAISSESVIKLENYFDHVDIVVFDI